MGIFQCGVEMLYAILFNKVNYKNYIICVYTNIVVIIPYLTMYNVHVYIKFL